MSKLSRAAHTFTLAAVACTAMTSAASANGLSYAASVIFKEAVGYGVDTAIASALGSTNETVDLSEETFERIEEIVEDVVATYQFSDYQTNVADALDASLAYTRRDGTNALLISSSDRAWDVYNDASSALNDMETTGYQGAGAYMLMSALQLSFLLELAEVEDMLGEDGDHYRELAADMAGDHYTYIYGLSVEWNGDVGDLFEKRTKTVRSWYDGWNEKKKKKMCIDYGDEERCTSSSYTCKRPWHDSSSTGWSCSGTGSVNDEINQIFFTAMMEATDEVFGAPMTNQAIVEYRMDMQMMLSEAGAGVIVF